MNMNEHGKLCAFLATTSPKKPDPDETVAIAGKVRRAIGRLKRGDLSDAQVTKILDKLGKATELLWDYDGLPVVDGAGVLSSSALVVYHYNLVDASPVIDFTLQVR